MTREGMVHALDKIHRALIPGGVLADIHPDRDPGDPRALLPQVLCIVQGEEVRVGDLGETIKDYRDYRAASRNLERAEGRGLFAPVSGDRFSLRHHLRDLAVFDDYVARFWAGAILAPAARRRLQSLVRARPDTRIVIAEPVRMSVMRKP